MYEIILASHSPRRRQLLDEAGYQYRLHPVKVSENIEENLNPGEFAETLSRRKAKSALKQPKGLKFKGKLLLSADTVVALDDRILGKPENFKDAEEYLALLSGKMHSVITGCTLVPDGHWSSEVTFHCETKVYFKTLGSAEIADYVATGEPMDKAGAYAIQGLGGNFVERYEGSWSNVVGLPLERLEGVLKKSGWDVIRK